MPLLEPRKRTNKQSNNVLRFLKDTTQGAEICPLSRYRHILVSRERKIVGATVSKRAMRTLESTLSSPVDIFLRQLLASPSDPVNITDRTKRLGVDIVGHLSFSYDLRLQTDEANRFLVMPSLWATTAAISTCRPPLYIKSTCALVGHFLYPSWDHFTDLLQTMISIIVTQKSMPIKTSTRTFRMSQR